MRGRDAARFCQLHANSFIIKPVRYEQFLEVMMGFEIVRLPVKNGEGM
jgi:hypothetical protein